MGLWVGGHTVGWLGDVKVILRGMVSLLTV